ncbi:hypothetical protein EV122DRAFT_169375, partial [Schizophyllum commune]
LPDLAADASTARSESKIPEISLANKFIDLLKTATLEGGLERLDDDVLEALLQPAHGITELTPDERLSIDIYLAVTHASEATYDAVRAAILRDRRCQRISVMSYHSVKALVRRVSGVTAVYRDMCVKSCVAFTGPFASLDNCPTCGRARYEAGHSTKVARKQFSTILLGPQLQALWRTPEGAKSLEYRRLCTERVLADLDANGGEKTTPYTDFFHGEDYLQAIEEDRIKDEDMVLMLSIDGAQLYRNKQSDCWMYIWVII